jgi:hypothetical protein
VVRRIAWEIFSFRIVCRRAVLDLVCGVKRQARLTEYILPYEHDIARRIRKEQRTGDQILRFVAPVRVEPRSGYVVRGRTGLIEESLHYSEDVRIRSQRHYMTALPTVGQLLKPAKSVSRVRAISLRHPYGENYFHATTECLAALALLDEHDLLSGRTVLVGPGLAATAVFRHAATYGRLAGLDIHVQDDRAVRLEEDVLVGRVAATGASFRRTEAFLTGHLPPPASASDVKLYLTRPVELGRTLRNEMELRSALNELGYVTVDPGALPWEEQVQLFRTASHVVSVHSSAMTNVLFRTRASMNVVEIRVPGRVNPDFERLVVGLGFPFRLIDGHNPSDDGHRPQFDADIATVLRAVEDLDKLTGS